MKEWYNSKFGEEIDYLRGKEPVKIRKGDMYNAIFYITIGALPYFFTSKEERDADYRKGTAMVVTVIEKQSR